MSPDQSILLDPFLPQEMITAFTNLVEAPRELGPLSLLGKAKVHLRNRRADMSFRVAYMTHLRSIIGRPGRVPQIPRNKLDVPLVSDFDCLDANLAEQIEAILRAEKMWKDGAR